MIGERRKKICKLVFDIPPKTFNQLVNIPQLYDRNHLATLTAFKTELKASNRSACMDAKMSITSDRRERRQQQRKAKFLRRSFAWKWPKFIGFSYMHGYSFMTMLPECESIYAIAWCISPPATLIYLCAAFIFWQFVSFDFSARALLEYSS